jgi:uncharacterized protein YndB with AHSA1/START domain
MTSSAASSPASDTSTIHVDQFVGHPPATVWKAITTPDLLARWWAEGDIAPVVGHVFHLDMGPFGRLRCEVLEVDADRRLVYTFGPDWTLTFTLVPEGRGTRLLLEHAGFDLDNPQHRFAFDNMGPGWRDEVLPAIPALLDAAA